MTMAPEDTQRSPRPDPTRRPIRTRLMRSASGLLVAGLVLWIASVVPARPVSAAVTLVRGHAWALLVVVLIVAIIVVATARVGLRRSAYDGPEDPDLRIDLLLGLAIVFVVLDHFEQPSLFQLVSQELIGPVSGAELLVALFGIVLGIRYRRRADTTDALGIAVALWSRALTLYATALVVVLLIFVVTLLPGVDGRVVTTFTDPGSGRTYDLYPNIQRLLDYPVPGFVLRDILLLRLGPYQFNLMGLLVVLLAVSPVLLLALRRRLVVAILIVSWLVYLVDSAHPVRLFAVQFEDPFPLFTWQLLFVHGLAGGWYWTALRRWAISSAGRVSVGLLVLIGLGLAFFSWNNPIVSSGYDLRLGIISNATYAELYAQWFRQPSLGLGRVLDVACVLVTGYALLTAWWKPLDKALGWLLIPLGQASLYVFILHSFLALIVDNVSELTGESVPITTIVQAFGVAVLWMLVTKEFLFGVVPRSITD